ncbi:Zn2 DNA-binding protein [Venustampulla echinocandica]|uniref:Zn2 DNA-binding protein n=1 Tax=Venustampulla echinocandica TaxID=2656787 RepID=A0A370TTY5_9HELO|nr:Zn2 DNA-binding protein [Venustampulla echinocandica]RDL38985.1 Zn2 DNA-binding protein [Venustampulla echinocandica]
MSPSHIRTASNSVAEPNPFEMSSEASASGEPPRKRIRKGTRSCWECKRRKVRCQLSSEDVPICSGCLARGTTCLSQEYPEEREPSSNAQVGERLGRVEHLLEKLIAKISAYEEEEKAQQDIHKDILTPESISSDVLTPHPSNTASGVQDVTPFMTLFDNPVLGRLETMPSQMATPVSQSVGTKSPSCRPSKIDRIRQTLVDLLPSQRDADLVSQSSSCWLLVHAMVSHTASAFDDSMVSSTFNMAEISKKHPTIIARTILYLAVSLQQLDPEFDTSQLHLLPTVEYRIDRYLSTVQALVTSDDELVTTVEGLECLVLQSVYHINAGNLRRAWLATRRALNTCQLMGFHNPTTEVQGGKEMWYQIVRADRYLALFLGLPVGSVDDTFGPEETFHNPAVDKDMLFSRKLCEISSRISDRNLAQNSQAYATTQEIDEKLDILAKDMPKSWWEIPAFTPETSTQELALHLDHIMTQIWYFQLEALLHLPFMLRAATERRYDYSKFTCLKASREMVSRYLAMNSTAKSFCCRVMDFGAFTSTVTLLLGLLEVTPAPETPEIRQQKENDRALVHVVVKSLEETSRDGKEVIATQSVNVIKSLLAMDSPSGRAPASLRLTIPYFGTITIVRPLPAPKSGTPAIQNKQTVTIDHSFQPPATCATESWTDVPFQAPDSSNIPMVSFTSSHFPPLMQEQPPMENWGLQDTDTFFFDSLLSTDIDGNWIV